MSLRNYLEEKAPEWVGYQRPAVDWMITEKGKPNSRLERTMHDFPEFAEVYCGAVGAVFDHVGGILYK